MCPLFTWRQDAILAAVAILFCGIAYWLFSPALDGPFIFDDFSNISHLSLIDGDVSRERLGSYLYSFSGSLGRPLSALSFLVNDSAWPTDPRPFKYTNLLIHLINGLLVFLLLLRLTSSLPASRSRLATIAITAMWLIAPLQVSSVMLTVQRMALLSAFFTLAGLLLHVRSLQAPGRIGSWGALLIMARLGGFSFLAFLCKENGALVPLFAACLHATLLRKNLLAIEKSARLLMVYGAIAPWIFILLYFAFNPSYIAGGYTGRDFTLGERVLTETRVLWTYVNNIVVPRMAGHGIFHDDFRVSASLLDPIATLFSATAWVLVAISAITFRKRTQWFAFAVLWFLTAHAMESTVISLEIYFEHRNYLAMLGPLSLLAVLLSKLRIRYSVALICAWLVLAGLSTHSNAKVWGSRDAMANIWFAEHPQSVRAVQLKASALTANGNAQGAIHLLESAYDDIPYKAELLFQTLPLRCALGTMSRELLPEYYDAASEARTPQIPANQLQDLRSVASQCNGSFTMRDWWHLTDILLDNPRMQASSNALAHIHYERAHAAVHQRDLNRAMLEFDRSYAAEANPFIPREQAIYLVSAGLLEEALEYLDKSDSTPVSLWKQWSFDAGAMNLDLRRAIEKAIRADRSRTVES